MTDGQDPDEVWAPLSRRSPGLGPREPYEGIPPHLRPRLEQWINDFRDAPFLPPPHLDDVEAQREWEEEVRLRLSLISMDPLEELTEEQLLNLIDGMLRWSPIFENRVFEELKSKLDRILRLGGSVWHVAPGTDWYILSDGLERRVDPTVKAAITQTVEHAGADAGEHLAVAWRSVYGRNPDPNKAYAEAVKAVEAAACPLVLPASDRATSGRVRDHLRDAATKWDLVLPDKDGAPGAVTPVVAMMTTLWEGQRSRHAGTPTSRRQKSAEAEAAVHLAATLVQWLHSGVLRRKP